MPVANVCIRRARCEQYGDNTMAADRREGEGLFSAGSVVERGRNAEEIFPVHLVHVGNKMSHLPQPSVPPPNAIPALVAAEVARRLVAVLRHGRPVSNLAEERARKESLRNLCATDSHTAPLLKASIEHPHASLLGHTREPAKVLIAILWQQHLC